MAAFLDFAETFVPDPVSEFEVNPLVVSDGRLVALDALVRSRNRRRARSPPRPLHKLGALLDAALDRDHRRLREDEPRADHPAEPARDGTPAARITVVKPGRGARRLPLLPALESLPARVDLLVLCIAAAQVPDAIASVLAGERGESVILIPGGLEESADRGRSWRGSAPTSRGRAPRRGAGPLVNGGNCLGVRSRPGRYNTLFIPEHKLPFPGGARPVALISQSGAFAVSR